MSSLNDNSTPAAGTGHRDSVRFLYDSANEFKSANFGLERIREALDVLDNPQDRLRIVHVAGTNGKGSTCAMIEAALRHSGAKTGLFTSPHLAEPTERIRIDGLPVSAERFERLFDQVHAVDAPLSYFEMFAAMAFVAFAEDACDVAVVEVGLGGTNDATNVVRPAISVITPVDFDHEALIGRGIESIAEQKAGILKAGAPAVFARQRLEVAQVLDRRAAQLSIPVSRLEGWKIHDLELTARGSRFLLSGECELGITCPLAGEHQVENAATAAIALTRLGVGEREIVDGIAEACWPGRLERISQDPEIIVDGGHNPSGARALAAYIGRFYANRRVRIIFGAMRDKAIDEIAGHLFPRADQVILTAPHQARATSPDALRGLIDHPNVQTAASLEDALALVRDASCEDVIFITGSLFLVAEARALVPVIIKPKR